MIPTRTLEELRTLYKVDGDDFTSFGDIARGELRQQCQYASYYVFGDMPEYPDLGKGLRFRNFEEAKSNYHYLRIHIEDVPELIRRYLEHRKARFGDFA